MSDGPAGDTPEPNEPTERLPGPFVHDPRSQAAELPASEERSGEPGPPPVYVAGKETASSVDDAAAEQATEPESGDAEPAGGEEAGPEIPADSEHDDQTRLEAEICETLRDYPDFPKPGILFRDIMPLFMRPRLFRRLTEAFAGEARERGAEKIAGIESRGFLIGTPLALALELPFVPVRKRGKLPGPVVSLEYELEYGTAHLELQRDRIRMGERVVLVDDLLATGGTAAASARLIEQVGGIVAGICFLVELEELSGRGKLGRYNIMSLITL